MPHNTNSEELFFLARLDEWKGWRRSFEVLKECNFHKFLLILPYFKARALGWNMFLLNFLVSKQRHIYYILYYCYLYFFFFICTMFFFTSWHTVCTELFQITYMNSSIITLVFFKLLTRFWCLTVSIIFPIISIGEGFKVIYCFFVSY